MREGKQADHDAARLLLALGGEQRLEGAGINAHFGTQRSKDWFDAEVFRGLARIRGMECRAPEGYAEAFYARKLSIM
jgi:hypothetical protein